MSICHFKVSLSADVSDSSSSRFTAIFSSIIIWIRERFSLIARFSSRFRYIMSMSHFLSLTHGSRWIKKMCKNTQQPKDVFCVCLTTLSYCAKRAFSPALFTKRITNVWRLINERPIAQSHFVLMDVWNKLCSWTLPPLCVATMMTMLQHLPPKSPDVEHELSASFPDDWSIQHWLWWFIILSQLLADPFPWWKYGLRSLSSLRDSCDRGCGKDGWKRIC